MSHNNDSAAWKKLRLVILARDDYTCRTCGHHDPTGKTLHIDHVVPKKAGGSDDPDNLAVLCQKHNLEKGSKTAGDRVTWFNPRWQQYWPNNTKEQL